MLCEESVVSSGCQSGVKVFTFVNHSVGYDMCGMWC